jgi:hypothetical protein
VEAEIASRQGNRISLKFASEYEYGMLARSFVSPGMGAAV